MQCSEWGLMCAEQMDTIPSLDLLATPLLMQPRMLLAFWAASMHCWLVSTRTCSPSPQGCSPTLYTYLGLPQPKRSTLHLPVMNLIWVTHTR